jgi:hypothetical protein
VAPEWKLFAITPVPSEIRKVIGPDENKFYLAPMEADGCCLKQRLWARIISFPQGFQASPIALKTLTYSRVLFFTPPALSG